jgi:hypothetical protein
MADNLTLPASAGTKLASKEIDGVQYPQNLIVDVTGVDAVGAVGDSPGANTILGRLKAIVTALANPLAVTGAFYQATQPVSGTVGVSGTVAVTGMFYQATQPVSAAALPLPTGAATSAAQASELAAVQAIGTRAYAAGSRLAVVTADAATSGLAATEVLLHASTRCFVRAGAVATNADIPLEAGEKFHMRLTSGQQIHVIRDTADGFLNVVPVA